MNTKNKLVAVVQDVAVRGFKTFCQVLASLLIADGTGILDTNWTDNLSVAGMAGLLSVLLSIASQGATGSPAIGEAVTPNPQVHAKQTNPSAPIEAGPGSPIPDGTPVQVDRVPGIRPEDINPSP